jgi:toxin CptA
MKSATAIAFDYRPSRWLFAAVILMAVLAFAAIALSGMPSRSGIFVAILAAACAGLALGRRLRPLVRRAVWQQAGHWRVTDADGREFTAELTRGVARGAWVVLSLRRSDGKNSALILGPDNCRADTRRQLRVRLARIERAA